MSQESILSVEALQKVFGGLVAVTNYSVQLAPREIVGLIGPNGAGKTTIINMLTGLEEPSRGRITFAGQRIQRRSAQQIARLGLGRTFQNLRLFGEFSARDNVASGLLVRHYYSTFDMLVRSPRFLKGERRLREQAEQLLAKVGLLDDADVQASSLPYGKQRRLEIARALALQPSLLLLDEPAAGMVDEEQQDLAQLLRELRSEGLTLLVIDHNIRFLLSVVDRVQVMNHGQLIAEGEPDKVVADPAVIEAYLGQEVEA
ncbi:MAG: ABC transporter ATP-binding protein [Deinococcota bacterium]|nr:ABC transporter ATP-binding protein [Deinococcota bacterium]